MVWQLQYWGAAYDGNTPVVQAPVRTLGPDTATSECLGTIRTPLCAWETWSACIIQYKGEFCRVVGLTAPTSDPRVQDAFILKEYVVVATEPIYPRHATTRSYQVWFGEYTVERFTPRAGAVRLRVLSRTCQATGCDYSHPMLSSTYIYEPFSDGWHLVRVPGFYCIVCVMEGECSSPSIC
jgi:hypothetical protein